MVRVCEGGVNGLFFALARQYYGDTRFASQVRRDLVHRLTLTGVKDREPRCRSWLTKYMARWTPEHLALWRDHAQFPISDFDLRPDTPTVLTVANSKLAVNRQPGFRRK